MPVPSGYKRDRVAQQAYQQYRTGGAPDFLQIGRHIADVVIDTMRNPTYSNAVQARIIIETLFGDDKINLNLIVEGAEERFKEYLDDSYARQLAEKLRRILNP